MPVITIEQRLQDPPRFLMLPADEAAAFGIPFMMGVMGKIVFSGFIIGVLIWLVWRRAKGEGGIVMFVGALYWFLPSRLRVFPGLPDSSVSVWEG